MDRHVSKSERILVCLLEIRSIIYVQVSPNCSPSSGKRASSNLLICLLVSCCGETDGLDEMGRRRIHVVTRRGPEIAVEERLVRERLGTHD